MPESNTPALRLDGVNLSEPAAGALHTIRALTGDTYTEAINKALTAYALMLGAQHAGGSVTVQASPDAEPDRIRFY